MLVEQHIKDGLDPQRKWRRRQGVAKRLGNGQGAKGVAVFAELLAIVQ